MKKYSWIFALIMALTMAFVFTACSGDDPEDETKKDDETQAGGGEFINFGTGAGQTQIVYNRNNGANTGNVGTVSYVTNGYKYTYAAASVGDSNYENVVARFKITLPAGEYLNKYGKVSFTWQASARALGTDPQKGPTADDPGPYASDVSKSKKLYLMATDVADDITPYRSPEDDPENTIKAIIVSSTSFDEDLSVNFWDGNGAGVNGITAQNIELPILYSKGWFRNDVWIAVYTHVNDPEASFTITNFKLVERAAGDVTEAVIADGGVNVTGAGPTLDEYVPPAKEGAKPFDFTVIPTIENSSTIGTNEGGLDTVLPTLALVDGKLQITFNDTGSSAGTNQRLNIKLSDDDVAALENRNGNGISFEIVGRVVEDSATSGDNFRYHIGAPGEGGNWNATNSDYNGKTFAAFQNFDDTFGANATMPGRLEYFIFSHRNNGNKITIEIESIRIYTTPFKVTFAEGDVKERHGTATLVDKGFTFKNTTDNYERSWAYFKVTFPTDKKLSDYAYFECNFTLIDTNYKGIFVAAFADEAAIDAIPSDGSDASKLPSANVIAERNSYMGATGEVRAEKLAITVGDVDANEVWIAIRSGLNSNETFKVTDISFK